MIRDDLPTRTGEIIKYPKAGKSGKIQLRPAEPQIGRDPSAKAPYSLFPDLPIVDNRSRFERV